MKRVIALILVALLSVSLFACGNSDSSKDTGDKTDTKPSFKYYDECAELPTFDSVTEARMSSKKTSSTNGQVTTIEYVYTGLNTEVLKAYSDCITQLGFEIDHEGNGNYSISKDGYILANFATLNETLTMNILPSKQDKNQDKNVGVWQCSDYVDEFEQPTGEKFVTNIELIRGKFSNSATTDSMVEAQLLADKTYGISIILWEYGTHQVKNVFTYDDEYDITIRYADGSKESLKGAVYGGGGDRIMITGNNAEILLNALSGDSEFALYIADSSNAANSYLLKLDPSNFAELYGQI